MARYILHPVSVDASYITGVTAINVSDGHGHIRPLVDGVIDPKFVALASESPRITVETTDLPAALAVCGYAGARTSGAGFVAYDAQLITGAVKGGAGVHQKLTMATALVVLRSIRLRHQGPATATFEAIGYNSTGLTAALITTTGQNLSAPTINGNIFHDLGPVSINGSVQSAITEVSIDTGIEVLLESADGGTTTKNAWIRSRSPVVEIRCADASARATFLSYGASLSSTGLICYGRKFSADGTHVADGTAEHLKFTFANGRIEPIGTSGDPREVSLRVLPRAATTDAMTISYASAIT